MPSQSVPGIILGCRIRSTRPPMNPLPAPHQGDDYPLSRLTFDQPWMSLQQGLVRMRRSQQPADVLRARRNKKSSRTIGPS